MIEFCCCLTRFASLLQEALDVRTYGQHMYFSYTQDLTRPLHARLKHPSAGPGLLWGTMDPQYVFNGGLLKPLIGERRRSSWLQEKELCSLLFMRVCGVSFFSHRTIH